MKVKYLHIIYGTLARQIEKERKETHLTNPHKTYNVIHKSRTLDGPALRTGIYMYMYNVCTCTCICIQRAEYLSSIQRLEFGLRQLQWLYYMYLWSLEVYLYIHLYIMYCIHGIKNDVMYLQS